MTLLGSPSPYFLADGRKFRSLVIIDAFTLECLAIEVDTSLSGESFNGKLRDECLSRYYFTGLNEARKTIETWRNEYN